MEFRNTSTDVEKTADEVARNGFVLETPPRTWRRHAKGGVVLATGGNTSTDVEKTLRIF